MQQPAAPPIIDMHCHTAGAGYGNSGCFISKKMGDSIKFKIYLNSLGVKLKELQQQGDVLIIKKYPISCMHRTM